MANIRINTIHEDLVIVYKDIVMNSKLQLENPMSRALAIPVADSLRTFSDQGRDIRGIPKVVDNYHFLVSKFLKFLKNVFTGN